ncbi:MAG: hypothetical protein BIP78_1618 [Candidatus Bipolaricaulis sibiricus]|uniref:Uncharacterized protein n=1 Tax=Bipolaricaulis sibiricus TaxID=2501609 RepID=A0A410FWM3_BIPS1|nr:MAG: hypothetical protein BIP78_1618 [Candidatus Bipolaricaulis sibiricus]
MARIRQWTLHEIEQFRKLHPVDHPIEAEQAKVHRERAAFAELRRKAARRVRRCLNELTDPGEDLVAQRYEAIATRELRNAAAHRRRLAGLAGVELHPGNAPRDQAPRGQVGGAFPL